MSFEDEEPARRVDSLFKECTRPREEAGARDEELVGIDQPLQMRDDEGKQPPQ
jgi:hypothetical protein